MRRPVPISFRPTCSGSNATPSPSSADFRNTSELAHKSCGRCDRLRVSPSGPTSSHVTLSPSSSIDSVGNSVRRSRVMVPSTSRKSSGLATSTRRDLICYNANEGRTGSPYWVPTLRSPSLMPSSFQTTEAVLQVIGSRFAVVLGLVPAPDHPARGGKGYDCRAD